MVKIDTTYYINNNNVLISLIFYYMVTNRDRCPKERMIDFNEKAKFLVRNELEKTRTEDTSVSIILSSKKFEGIVSDEVNTYSKDKEFMRREICSLFMRELGSRGEEVLEELWHKYLNELPPLYLELITKKELLNTLFETELSEKNTDDIRRFVLLNSPQLNPSLIVLALCCNYIATGRSGCSNEQIHRFVMKIVSLLGNNYEQDGLKNAFNFIYSEVGYVEKAKECYTWNREYTHRIFSKSDIFIDERLGMLWGDFVSTLPSEVIEKAISLDALSSLLGSDVAICSWNKMYEFISRNLPLTYKGRPF